MNKKRTLLTVVAMILVCVLSIMGTVAFLQDTTDTVTNTFIAAGGSGPFIDEDDDGKAKFELKEYKVTQSTTGKYTQTEEEVTQNDYNVMPGTTIPKQVFVKLSRTGAIEDGEPVAPAPAYLYLEVSNGLDADEYTWSVDAANWKKLGTVTNEGKTNDIYQYIGEMSDDNNVLTYVEDDAETTDVDETKIDIVTNDEVVAEDVTLTAGEFKLSFNAYLAQASIGDSDDAVAVFQACFNKTITVPSTGDGD